MKQIISLLSIILLLGCFSKEPSIDTGLEGKLMPSFNLLLMDSTTIFNTGNIPKGQPTVLLLINPYCPYCKLQTQEIIKEINKLTDINIYLFSVYPFGEIKSYYDSYQLGNISNIVVGKDYENYFGNYYPISGVPYFAIYDRNKILKKVLVGKVSINLIKDIAFR